MTRRFARLHRPGIRSCFSASWSRLAPGLAVIAAAAIAQHAATGPVRSEVRRQRQAPLPAPSWSRNMLADAKAHGDARRGAAVFQAATSACLSCHKIGKQGGEVGPDLSAVGTCTAAGGDRRRRLLAEPDRQAGVQGGRGRACERAGPSRDREGGNRQGNRPAGRRRQSCTASPRRRSRSAAKSAP